MSKATQGALFLLAIVFLGLGGYYLFVAPEPSGGIQDPSAVGEVPGTGNGPGTLGVEHPEAFDFTNLDSPVNAQGVAATEVGGMPANEVTDSRPGAGAGIPETGATVAAGGGAIPAIAPDATFGATPPVAPVVTAPAEPSFTLYTIKKKDTFTSIAAHFYGSKGSADVLVKANPGIDPNLLKIGSTIKIPRVEGATSLSTPTGGGSTGTGDEYTVADGDTLSTISEKFYGSQKHWEAIYDANKSTIGSDPGRLKKGMKLRIPAKP